MNSAPMREAFCRLVQNRYPQAACIRPEKEAAQGAVEIALRWLKNGGDCKALLRSREA